MFSFIGDVLKGTAKVVGAVTGGILAIPITVVAETLGITIEMVKTAKNAGCETYDEVIEFYKED